MKVLQKIILIIIGIPVCVILISLIISFPYAGKSIAMDKNMVYPGVIAHRGAAYLAPELTIASFSMARDIGADYIETDIQLTRDGVIMNFHDDTLDRTTNVAEIFPGREKDLIGSFTYKELMQLDVGSWFNKKFPKRAQKGYVGLKIPTFKQYITVLLQGKHKPGLCIELKDPSKSPGIEKKMLKELADSGWLNADYSVNIIAKESKDKKSFVVQSGLGENRVIFQSFEEDSLRILKKLAPNVRRNFLVDKSAEKKHKGFVNLLKIADELESEIGPVGYMAWPWYLGKAHKQKKYVFMWTIDQNWQFRMVTFFGADAIITNRCDKFLEFIGRGVLQKPVDLLKKYH
jgi:glycerophosphoryl diester phosphodiesterase